MHLECGTCNYVAFLEGSNLKNLSFFLIFAYFFGASLKKMMFFVACRCVLGLFDLFCSLISVGFAFHLVSCGCPR
jgi:hypothetical protein